MVNKTKADDKVTPIAVANYLLEKANEKGKTLTPLQLIKLVYLCHGWNLAFDRGPLLVEQPQAWRYGPVLPSLYYAVRHFGKTPVQGPIAEGGSPTADLTALQKQVNDAVFEAYSDLSGVKLSSLTHRKDTPWHVVWSENGRNTTIPDELIKSHFREMRYAG